MRDAEINALLEGHFASFYRELTNIYKKSKGYTDDFDGYPKKVQLALLDMIFNLGAGKIVTVFVTFNAKIKAGDWKEAAAQSNRPQLSLARNLYVKQLLLDAASASSVPVIPGKAFKKAE